MLELLKSPVFPVFGLLFSLVACGPVDDRMEITDQRELPSGHQAPALGKSLRERMLPAASMGGSGTPETDPIGGGGANLAELFDSEVPDGWKELAPQPMRLVNMRFGEGDVGECYLTILNGGGSLAANVGRWYGQMGLEPPSEEEVAALPRAPLMNRTSVVIDVEGEFSAMGSAPQPGYRLVGRIMPPQQAGDTAFTMFLKMTGPEDVVAANLEKFEQFCQSLKPKQSDPSEEQ